MRGGKRKKRREEKGTVDGETTGIEWWTKGGGVKDGMNGEEEHVR